MAQALETRRIIMNFSTPPGAEDLHAVAISVLDNCPDELSIFIDDMDLSVEEFAPRETLDELDIDSEYDLLAIYRDTAEKIPGVVSKSSGDQRRLVLYRRPILDLWADTGDDLVSLTRNVIISELAQANGFSDEEIESLCEAAANAGMI